MEEKKTTTKPKATKAKAKGGLDTTNPFLKGVTYEAFQKNLTGKNTVDSLLKKHKCSKEQIDWIKNELSNLKK